MAHLASQDVRVMAKFASQILRGTPFFIFIILLSFLLVFFY